MHSKRDINKYRAHNFHTSSYSYAWKCIFASVWYLLSTAAWTNNSQKNQKNHGQRKKKREKWEKKVTQIEIPKSKQHLNEMPLHTEKQINKYGQILLEHSTLHSISFTFPKHYLSLLHVHKMKTHYFYLFTKILAFPNQVSLYTILDLLLLQLQ